MVRLRQYNETRREQQREYDRQRRLRPGYYKENYAKRRDKIIDAFYRRKALLLGAPAVEPIDRQAIIERDRGICYLCGQVPASDQITLDHVIPLSRGGSHTADNLKVACGICNSRKGTRLVEELDWV